MDAGHEPPTPPILRTVHRPNRPTEAETEKAFRAAVWLIALVVAATGLLLLAGRHTLLNPPPATVTVLPEIKPAPEKKHEKSVAIKTKSHDETTRPTNALTTTEIIPPRAYPVGPNDGMNSNGVPIAPLAPASGDLAASSLSPGVTPGDVTGTQPGVRPSAPAPVDALSVQTALAYASLGLEPPPFPTAAAALTAYQARDLAESGLSPSIIAPTGRASLLKIIGRRTPGSPAPRSWTFYFYDAGATGNATYRTVRSSRIVRDGEAITVAVFPWHVDDILGEDKLKIDSDTALAIAQALIPAARISSSAIELWRPRNSEPVWKLTLWARDHDGAEQEIGTVTILTENGYVLSKDLTAPAG
jgi:hypothetical protein